MDHPIRIAVIGVNRIGNLHCRYAAAHPHARLVAVCDLLEERAQAAAAQWHVPAYTDMQRMLDEVEIDLVSVATAGVEKGSHHYAPVMAAMEAGKAVLVEKPLSNDIVQAREMVQFAEEKGIVLACNLNHRFTPAAEKAKKLMVAGKLGTPLFANMKLTIANRSDETEWVHLRALHPHSIDVMRYFLGNVKRVQAFMTKAPGRKSWSTASINMEFASGAVGHLTGSYDLSMKHPIESCEVAGNAGRFVIDNVYENMVFYPHEQDETIWYRNPINGGVQGFHDTFKSRISRLIEQMKDGVEPGAIEASGADALAAQEVIEAAIRSYQTGGSVIDVANASE